ncbi:DUF771 domain-containing protein [Enterococcus faecalis]|nr:DUF771 domain-containing protein [Enterococcus faecalis]EGO8348908.1 DUF771 domain-containing protein [Enterococcus faecalis]EGO8841279.1 DUF771 domain-containing protein [Enterococcus faecalis]EGO9476308.1 DUF771 domain-containing protein [Enterococcus faecalis]EGS1161916.1 DUF771 domain-containing protein [Enterococcus faecalis]
MEQIIEYKAQIVLPDNFILIQRDEYENLKKASFKGNCISVEEFRKKHTCLSRPMFNEVLLLNPKFKKVLDIKTNPEGCIVYPKGRNSGKYYILESKLMMFIEEKFSEIFSNDGKNKI